MGIGILKLQEAIQESLASFTTLADFVEHGQIDPHTGQQKISIFKAEPSFLSHTRQVAFKVLSKDSLTPDNPGSWNSSEIYIYGAANKSEHAEYIADLLDYWFSQTPENESRNCWFRDLSNGCITTSSVIYTGRILTTKVRNKSNTRTDMWTSGITIEVNWANFGCDGDCTEFVPEDCPLEIVDNEITAEDCCE